MLLAKIALYGTVVNSSRTATVDISTATKQIAKLLEEADTVIEKTLDKLILQFKTSAPEFYAKYQAARKIVNTGARPKKAKNGAGAATGEAASGGGQ